MQTRVRELFRTLFDRQEDVCIVDAGKTLEEVSREIQDAVSKCLGRLSTAGQLGSLGPLPN